ncbi:cell wall-active antibiotics response protein LiaF [Paenibacillus artemisiicola]|nr:cell wall-active antibiotics response protein LiaF [Paenibacillus artemisiicola]
MNGNFINRLMWGLLIIVVGVGLLLRQGGYVNFDIGAIFSVFWPVILMFLGVQGLLQRMAYGRGSAFGSGVLIVLGFLFLGRNLDLFVWSVGDMIKFAGPLVLIIFGLSMIFKPKAKKRGDDAKDKWKDEWQAYNYGPTEEPAVPPAPPLHPDPTLASFDFGDGGAGAKEAPSGQSGEQAQGPRQSGQERPQGPRQGPHQGQGPSQGPRRERPEGEAGGGMPPYGQGFPNHSLHHKRMSHAERHALHAAKVRERIERRHFRHYQRHQRHLDRKDRVEWWNHDPNVQTRSGFIGDIYLGHDYWELKPMNISHFIGDTVLDLTKAQIVPGETVINISSFIGDVKVYLPNDYEFGVHVVSSAFVGDVAVLEQKEGGIFKNIDAETPYFQEMDKKIILHVSTFIGDVRVTKVG